MHTVNTKLEGDCMKKLSEKYTDIKILAHFLANPTRRFYIKELSRLLKISPRSAQEATKMFASDEILSKEEIGRTYLYKLNNDLPLVAALKKTYALSLLHDLKIVEKFLENDENIISLAIYGSYSSGRYDEKSDLDIIVITPALKSIYKKLREELGKLLNLEVSIEIFTLADWDKLSKNNDAFRLEVIKNNTVLYGSEIL